MTEKVKQSEKKCYKEKLCSIQKIWLSKQKPSKSCKKILPVCVREFNFGHVKIFLVNMYDRCRSD